MAELAPTARVALARTELGETLDELGDRINPCKVVARLPETVRRSWRRDPVPWIIGGGLAVLVAAGAVAWAFLADD